MDARYLDPEKRKQLVRSLIERRSMLERFTKRLQDAGWYTDDPVFQCVKAATASLHAAINHVGMLSPEVRPPEPPPARWDGIASNHVSSPK